MKRRKRSLPSRERGLKSSIGTSFAMIADSSLPSRERGLKYPQRGSVWGIHSRSLRGSVD